MGTLKAWKTLDGNCLTMHNKSQDEIEIGKQIKSIKSKLAKLKLG